MRDALGCSRRPRLIFDEKIARGFVAKLSAAFQIAHTTLLILKKFARFA
jgi:hypothetical protein